MDNKTYKINLYEKVRVILNILIICFVNFDRRYDKCFIFYFFNLWFFGKKN